MMGVTPNPYAGTQGLFGRARAAVTGAPAVGWGQAARNTAGWLGQGTLPMTYVPMMMMRPMAPGAGPRIPPPPAHIVQSPQYNPMMR